MAKKLVINMIFIRHIKMSLLEGLCAVLACWMQLALGYEREIRFLDFATVACHISINWHLLFGFCIVPFNFA